MFLVIQILRIKFQYNNFFQNKIYYFFKILILFFLDK
jgi:hypothetical protein